MRALNQTKVRELEFEVSHLQEQLATAISWIEVLEQEKVNLARDLEASHSWENTALDEISLMLSWTQLAEDKAIKAETSLENALE